MSILIGKRRKPKFKISEYEFNITKLLLDAFGIDIESDLQLTYNYNPIMISGQPVYYTDQYIALPVISKDLNIFRPLKNDKHANILIDMFEELDIIEIDNLTVLEYENKYGRKVNKGYFMHNGKKIEDSYTYNCATTAILKVFMLAKYMFDQYEYDIFLSNLKYFSYSYNRGMNHNV